MAALLLVLLAFGAAPATRAESPLEVLQVGWDGTVVPGTWSPVRLRITGGNVDVTGRVEVVLKVRNQLGPQAPPIEYPVAAYGEDVALPAGVAKEITLWVPADGNAGGTVRLSAAGQTLAEQSVEFRSARTPFWPLVGVLAEAPVVARGVARVELPFQGLPVPLSVARLTAADLPPVADRLRALSALVVQGSAGTSLTGEQRRALHGWVVAGGHLLLAGGPDAPRAAAVLPSGVLPITFVGSDGAADLSGLARWAEVRESAPIVGPLARFQPAVGTLLAGDLERPLAWRLGLGQGTITLLAADPALQPLASWSGTAALWQKALEPALPGPVDNEKMRYIRSQERTASGRLVGAVELLPADAFPGWKTIAVLLGGFALAVGPLAHLFLWRIDRREWIWLIVPAAAVLATATLYVVGIGRDGRDVLANVVAYVRLDPETGQAQQSLVAGFVAPTRPALAVTLPGDVPVRVNGAWKGPMYGPGGVPLPVVSADPPFHVLNGRDTRIEFTAGEWGMRSLMVDRTLDGEAGRITARLGLEGGLVKGTVRNDTPYPLEDAAVVVGQSLVRLGNLAPGQVAPVVLDPGPADSPFRGGPSIAYRLFGRPPEELAASGRGGSGAVYVSPPMPARPPALPPPGVGMSLVSPPPLPPERLELPRDPEVWRRVRLMDSVLTGPRGGPGGQPIPLTFLAFTRAPVGNAVPRAGNHPIFHLTLIEQPLRLELSPGTFTMPASLIQAETLTQNSRGLGSGGNGFVTWIELHSGTIVYGFRPPLPARARPEALVVVTRQVGPSVSVAQGRNAPPPTNLNPSPTEAGVFSIYNWQSGTWDLLPPGQEQTRLNSAPYLGPEGLVRVQVTAAVDRLVRFMVPELSVEGRVDG